MPMLPEAPLRFSITILPPSWLASGSAIRRAMMSTLPPGGKGAISRIGWLGYGCAAAGAAASSTSAQNRMRIMVRPSIGAFMIATQVLEEDLGLKAPSFAYAKPGTLAEAFELLEREGAKVLAGGQSLIPSLNMRLSAPALLVDLTGLAALRSITLEQGVVRIGALTTHADIERSEAIAKHVPLLAEAVTHVAHPAIRNRGTLGGSVALADPAAEYPACLVALDATIVVKGTAGERLAKA